MKVSCLLFLLAFVGVTVSANADSTYTYIYTGNPFTTGSGSISGSMTLGSPLLPNLVDATIHPESFSFTDGNVVITNNSISMLGAEEGEDEFADFSTDSNGNITGWKISVTNAPYPEFNGAGYQQLETCAVACNVDESIVGEEFISGTPVGRVSDDPGSWQATPEPSSFALIGIGLTSLGTIRRKLRR